MRTEKRKLVVAVILTLLGAACSSNSAEPSTTAPPTSAAPLTTVAASTTTLPDPASAHVVDGTYFATYTVAGYESTGPFFHDADVGDILTTRLWTMTAGCDEGPCDLESSSVNPDLGDLPHIEGQWTYADGVYSHDELLEPDGTCELDDGSIFDGAFDHHITMTITPTDFVPVDGHWVASLLEGNRIVEGTPSAAAAAAGCTAEFTDEFDVVATLLPPDLNPSLLPSGSEPVGDVIAVGSAGSVVSINPDGTGETVIVDGASPSWSSERNMIAFDRDGSIYLANADGSDERPITRGHDPRWSPDGHTLVFARDVGQGADIMTVSVATGAVQRITDGGWATIAEWIDDSTLAVQEFRSDLGDPDGWLFWRWPLEGDPSDDDLIGQRIGSLSAAPGGGRIAYIELGSNDLYVADTDGSNATVLVSGDGEAAIAGIAAHPVWSPDGDRIAWYNGGQLWIVDVESGGASPIGYEVEGEPTLAWR
jgi:WD40-like Beta Propeller Repeat